MVAQKRGAEDDDEATTSSSGQSRPKKKSPERVPKNTSPRKKLSFNQQHALKTLPERLERTEKELASLQEVLLDPALYSRYPDKYAATADALSEKQAELEGLEEEWLELEMLREELEGN